MHVGTPIPYINDPITGDPQTLAELLEYRHLSVACRHPCDRPDLARPAVVLEFRAVDPLAPHDALERRHHDLPRCGGDHAKVKRTALDSPLQEIDELRYRALETYTPPRCDEMLPPYTAKIWVVPDQVRKLAPLLHEIAAREPLHLLLEGLHSEELGKRVPRIAETQRLIEVASEQIMSDRCGQVSLRIGRSFVRQANLSDSSGCSSESFV